MILDPHKEAISTIGERMSEIIDGTLNVNDITTYGTIVSTCGQALAKRLAGGYITLNEAAQVAVEIGNVLHLSNKGA